MDANKIIDALGGTNAVARICKVSPASVTQWREKIPAARLMFLQERFHNLFCELGYAPPNPSPDACSGAGSVEAGNAPFCLPVNVLQELSAALGAGIARALPMAPVMDCSQVMREGVPVAMLVLLVPTAAPVPAASSNGKRRQRARAGIPATGNESTGG